MTQVRARGVQVQVPRGWECQIRRCDDAPGAPAAPVGELAAAAAGPLPRAVAHVANFALPAERGDFGGGAVELMGARNVFVALVEFDRADAGTALFARQGIPRRLRAGDFHPEALQRTIGGQAGHQTFFTERGRAFCLYVVLGSHRLAGMTVPAVNEILATLEVE